MGQSLTVQLVFGDCGIHWVVVKETVKNGRSVDERITSAPDQYHALSIFVFICAEIKSSVISQRFMTLDPVQKVGYQF